MKEPIPEKVIIRSAMGSLVYGTNHQDSDEDFMAVVCADEMSYLSLNQWGSQGTKQIQTKDEYGDVLWEMTSYELTKFVRLCENFNPNVIVLLWLREKDYLDLHEWGRLLIENRHMFSSKVSISSFCGYAYNQLGRMGQDGAPTGQLGKKRKDIRDQYGFDTKYMYHAVRLTRMIREFMENKGESLNVWRGDRDAEELLKIRFGAWSYEHGKNYIEQQLDEIKSLAETSGLPDQPDKQAIRDIVRYILRQHLTL